MNHVTINTPKALIDASLNNFGKSFSTLERLEHSTNTLLNAEGLKNIDLLELVSYVMGLVKNAKQDKKSYRPMLLVAAILIKKEIDNRKKQRAELADELEELEGELNGVIDDIKNNPSEDSLRDQRKVVEKAISRTREALDRLG